jgi:hypothetical protein
MFAWTDSAEIVRKQIYDFVAARRRGQFATRAVDRRPSRRSPIP